MSEKHEQIALFQRAALHPICKHYMMAHEAGGYRNLFEAVSLKKKGVKPGFPDISLYYPNGIYYGLFIELKTIKGRLSKLQQEWILKLNSVGYCAVVCRGWQEAWETIEEYLK